MKKIINEDALKYNLTVLDSYAGTKAKLAPVIKGNAYGHGMSLLAKLLAQWGYRFICVYHPEEALKLAPQYSDIHWLVMGRTPAKYLGMTASYANIHCAVVDMHHLNEIIEITEEIDHEINIHLKVDTGFYRLGIPYSIVDQALRKINTADKVNLTGIYTHLADASNAVDASYSELQNQRLSMVLSGVNEDVDVHVQNSGGLVALPELNVDYARTGLAMYGYWPNSSFGSRADVPTLKPVMSVSSRIASLKDVPRGERFNYGLSVEAQRDMRLGIVPVGYSDGLPMALANKGHVLVNGTLVPIVGPVNMNSITLDLTDLDGADVYDEVVIIGSQNGSKLTFEDWSRWIDVSVYELMTRIQ